jgi:hypothetical protein
MHLYSFIRCDTDLAMRWVTDEYGIDFRELTITISKDKEIRMKLRGHRFRAMLTAVQSRTFFPPVCSLKNTTIFRLHKTIILLVALYGCETWSLTLREEYRLRVLENRVFR